MVKIPSPRRLFRSRSKSTGGGADICAMVAEHEKIEWEVRPGGMLVQKRWAPEEDDDLAGAVDVIQVRTSGSPPGGNGTSLLLLPDCRVCVLCVVVFRVHT